MAHRGTTRSDSGEDFTARLHRSGGRPAVSRAHALTARPADKHFLATDFGHTATIVA
jgi:hypothetical protein